MFKSKSESDLSQIVLDPIIFSPITPKKNLNFFAKDQKLFWDTLSLDLNKELLIESPISGKSHKFIVKNKFDLSSQPLYLSATSPTTEHQTFLASSSIIIHFTPPIHIPPILVPIVTPYQTPPPNISLAMAARFVPLVLPTQLHDMPYSQRIKTYGVEGHITAQQHLDRFNDYCDFEEVDYEDVKLRLFAQSFSGEVKKWFRGLQAGSIHDFQEFEIVFLRKWEYKQTPYKY